MTNPHNIQPGTVLAVTASTPGGIEAQERRGQAEVVAAANRLPVRLNSRDYSLAEIADRLGFVFGDPLPDDPLFRAATLPTGWALQATGHAMHSDILDAQGRPRGSVYYKAAFYDRQADWSLRRRYFVHSLYSAAEVVVGVMDAADSTWTFQAGEVARDDEYRAAYAEVDRLTAVAEQWLAANLPGSHNVFAYWD